MFKRRNPYSSTSRPKDWLIESIVVLLVFNVPLGIVALVYSSKVNKRYEAGEYAAAHDASYKSSIWNVIGLVSGIIIYAVYFILK